MKPFFYRSPNLLSLDSQFGQLDFGAFGVFLADLSETVLILWVPCPCFLSINHYFYKKLSFYIYPNSKHLFWTWIWIWAAKNWGFSHRVAVVGANGHLVFLSVMPAQKYFTLIEDVRFCQKMLSNKQYVLQIKSSFCHVLERNKSNFLFNRL